ncbi:MAG: hypothetical protein JWN93_1453 [Hyphomicrobiales bacterium]|jgi:hypothetical protein|nr:hypothetical protein [Hyphomicrobiales bacterium]
MRFLIGLIFGVILTIGGAYVVDQRRMVQGGSDGPLVNWDRVDRTWGELRQGAREQFRRITDGA